MTRMRMTRMTNRLDSADPQLGRGPHEHAPAAEADEGVSGNPEWNRNGLRKASVTRRKTFFFFPFILQHPAMVPQAGAVASARTPG